MTLIASSRMYNVTEAARHAWEALFDWVSRRSGVALKVTDHPAPAPLEELWKRPDMGCVFMCGWPVSRAKPQPHLIAAPIPSSQRYAGKPVYFTDLIVRKRDGFRSLKDTFGRTIAWTVETSHSGFNAPRHHLLPFRSASRPNLYRQSVGPVLTPAGSLASVVENRADIAPMDSYALDLIRRHEPHRVAEITVIDSTASATIPPLVASPEVSANICEKLKQAFMAAGASNEIADVLAALGLTGFAGVEANAYRTARTWDREALDAGYHSPG